MLCHAAANHNLVFLDHCSNKPPSILWNYLRVLQLSQSLGLSHQLAVAKHIEPSLANLVTTSATTVKRKRDFSKSWCIPSLTSNSSDNSETTLTFVFAQSFKLITDLSKPRLEKSIPFSLNDHSNTFLGTQSLAFSRSTKHIYNILPLP